VDPLALPFHEHQRGYHWEYRRFVQRVRPIRDITIRRRAAKVIEEQIPLLLTPGAKEAEEILAKK
jgi:hypothetical protein